MDLVREKKGRKDIGYIYECVRSQIDNQQESVENELCRKDYFWKSFIYSRKTC